MCSPRGCVGAPPRAFVHLHAILPVSHSSEVGLLEQQKFFPLCVKKERPFGGTLPLSSADGTMLFPGSSVTLKSTLEHLISFLESGLNINFTNHLYRYL